MSIDPSEFPAAFEPAVYRDLHSDLWYLPDDALRDHYHRIGRAEGRRPHRLADRTDLLNIVAHARSILEIGPSTRPLLTGRNVRLFDVIDIGEQARRAGRTNDPDAAAPKIDYVSPSADLSIVDRTFEVVISSHAIEHQPDLVGHLRSVEEVLKPGGYYVIMAPDKRYCFDHFIPESTIGDVIEAALERRTRHSARSLVNQGALHTHNEPVRHWAGDHSQPIHLGPGAIEAAMDLYVESERDRVYVDRHAWQFTDASFETIVGLLNDLGVISLPLLRVYPTMSGRHEFWAVLGPKPAGETKRAGSPTVAVAAAHAQPSPPQTTWDIDSIQPQPNLLVIRGWSVPPPRSAWLSIPDGPHVAGAVHSCERRERWGPADPEQRRAGFIALFPLAEDLTVEQLTASRLQLHRTDGVIDLAVPHIGASRVHAEAAIHGILERWIASIGDDSRVIELGARSRTSASIRDSLPGSFTGVDIVPGSGVDVVADAHLLSDALGGRTFTHAFSTSVFEHLFCPIQAASELNAVLEDGALAYIHSHQAWGYHEAPWDFFRFSDSAWRAIFNEVTGFEVLETAMSDQAILVPVTEFGNASLHRQASHGGSFQTSVVLARKIGPSRAGRIFSAADLQRVYPGFYPD